MAPTILMLLGRTTRFRVELPVRYFSSCRTVGETYCRLLLKLRKAMTLSFLLSSIWRWVLDRVRVCVILHWLAILC